MNYIFEDIVQHLKLLFNRVLRNYRLNIYKWSLLTGDIRKELPVIKPNQSVLPVLIYRVTIETMALSHVAADAKGDVECPDVFIRLFGERGV